jgi:glycosyltransferase involved in cell wall biosynthesis
MIGYREPGYLWKMNKPLVWGPIGGFQMTPWKLLPSMGLKGFVFYASRNLINLWQMRFNRRVRTMAQRASYIICATQDGYNAVAKFWKRDAVIIPEVGLTSIPTDNVSNEKDDDILRLCWSGMHEPRKSLNLLLEAVNLCQNKEHIEVNVVGDGPSNGKWKRFAARLGLQHINWFGWVPRDTSLRLMQSSHAFVITSLCDDTTTVVLEALSMGLPVVALNHTGFANVLTNECGIKIDICSRAQVVRDLANAIDRLYEDKSYRHSLGQGAKNRAQDFTWDKKVQMIYDIYSKIVKS